MKISAAMKKSVRFQALQTLERIEKGGAYSNLLLNDVINQQQWIPADRGLFTELVYGTTARKLTLNYYISQFVDRKLESWVETLLAMSFYQMFFLDRIPAHAVINEAVEIAKKRGNIGVSKLVNGVLRNAQRRGLPEFPQTDPLQETALAVSLPVWLVEKLAEQIGLAETRQLGEALLEPAHVSARVNGIPRAEAISALAADGIEVLPSEVSPYGVVAERGHLASSQLFQYGGLTIQDESSMLVAPTMRLTPDAQVLDACAAPGGKTTHIASFLEADQGGKVTALDIHAHKIKLIQQNAARLHVTDVVETRQLDARKIGATGKQFDRVLVDAPCSGLGLMRRKPDIKYHKTAADFAQLPKIQLEILESAAQTVKPSGIITYSTCTIVAEENQEVVAAFLARHPEFEKIPVEVDAAVQPFVQEDMLMLYPHSLHTDGFFICCMRRK